MEESIYKIAVCDDDRDDIITIENMIQECYPEKNFEFDSYTETDTVISALKEKAYDILILDLQFADDDSRGISVLEYCEKTEYSGYIIFMSKIREEQKKEN